MPRLRSKSRCTYRRAATIALCCTAIGSCGRADAHSLRGAAPEDSEDPDDSLTEEPGSTKDYLTKSVNIFSIDVTAQVLSQLLLTLCCCV